MFDCKLYNGPCMGKLCGATLDHEDCPDRERRKPDTEPGNLSACSDLLACLAALKKEWVETSKELEGHGEYQAVAKVQECIDDLEKAAGV